MTIGDKVLWIRGAVGLTDSLLLPLVTVTILALRLFP